MDDNLEVGIWKLAIYSNDIYIYLSADGESMWIVFCQLQQLKATP